MQLHTQAKSARQKLQRSKGGPQRHAAGAQQRHDEAHAIGCYSIKETTKAFGLHDAAVSQAVRRT